MRRTNTVIGGHAYTVLASGVYLTFGHRSGMAGPWPARDLGIASQVRCARTQGTAPPYIFSLLVHSSD